MKPKNVAARTTSPSLGLEVALPGASAQNPISIADLTSTIRELLETGIGEVWVAGEISNFRAPGSGHLYFTLKDATATLAAVMFQREARRVGFALADGQAVLVRGTITVYEARGQYQLQVAEIRPRGQGSLQQRFEELKRKLTAEGLFELDRKRELPEFPEVIGVVTSLQGAVLQDMLNILKRRAPGLGIRVRGVRVQGIGAAEEIAQAIGEFSAEGNIDLLVVARGGGSLEDLWAFNEEAVARALAACRVPTISAVGHETDFTIADFVADLRAPTPSAAAELLTRDWAEWREVIAKLRARLERTTRQVLADHRRQLARLGSSYALREPRRVVRQWAQRLDDLRENLCATPPSSHPAAPARTRALLEGAARRASSRARDRAPSRAPHAPRGPPACARPAGHARSRLRARPRRARPSTDEGEESARRRRAGADRPEQRRVLGAQVTEAQPEATLVDAAAHRRSRSRPRKRKNQSPKGRTPLCRPNESRRLPSQARAG